MYRPTSEDLVWAETVLGNIKDGGILGYPKWGLVYRVNHSGKLVTLLNPQVLSDADVNETHKRTVAVFGAVGYSVAQLT